MPANQTLFTSTAALGASQTLASPWLDRGGSGTFPTFIASVLADQDGSFLLYEGETPDGGDSSAVGGGQVLANIATVATGTISKRFVQLVYTNGTTAQASFALTLLGSQTPHISRSADARVWDLILRELRAQTALLQGLKEPSPSTINLPFGPL